MKVRCMFLKKERGQPVVRVPVLHARAGQGILDDIHAGIDSPRQVLLVSSSVLGKHRLRAGDLQETLTVDGDVDALTSGTVLQIGRSALVRVTFPCTPCAKLTRIRPTLPKELWGCRGILGRVVGNGWIIPGDSVTVCDGKPFRALSSKPKERLWDMVSRIPRGNVVKFTTLTVAIGMPASYVRALPRLLLHAPLELPVHRVVDSSARPITRHVPDQLEKLAAEGMRPGSDGRFEENALWDRVFSAAGEKEEC